MGGVSPGPPAGGLEWKFRVEVQRGLGKSNLAGCSGASEKVGNSSLKLQFLKPSCGGVFPSLPAGGLEWEFKVKV